jgi:hypothetical protein
MSKKIIAILKYISIFLLAYILGVVAPIFRSFYEIEIENQTSWPVKINIIPESQYDIFFTIPPNAYKNIRIYNKGDSGYTITANLNEKNIKTAVYLENNSKQRLYVNEFKIGKK